MPIAVVNGKQVNESLNIVKHVSEEATRNAVHLKVPYVAEKHFEEDLRWGTERLAKYFPPNIYGTRFWPDFWPRISLITTLDRHAARGI